MKAIVLLNLAVDPTAPFVVSAPPPRLPSLGDSAQNAGPGWISRASSIIPPSQSEWKFIEAGGDVTQLYDRGSGEASFDDAERISIGPLAS